MKKVDQKILNSRVNSFKSICTKNKLPLTPQKTAIYEFVASTCTHPNSQQIYCKLLKKFPNLSFATVYKNLNKFVNLGLIKEIKAKDNVTRYDANLDNHHHIINLKTGDIEDIYLDFQLPIPKRIKNKKLDHISINYFIK